MGTGVNLTYLIKSGFQGVVLPRIRTLIIPGDCHEILKCCPRVTKVWCNRGNGSKLVAVIATHCKEVQEMRGFLADENFIKLGIKTDDVLVACTFEEDEGLVQSGLIEELKIVMFPNSSIGIIEAAPNLRVLDMNDRNFLVRFFLLCKRVKNNIGSLQPIINVLPSFKNINTIIIKASGSDIHLNKCINATKRGFKDLGPSNERRHIRIWHKSNDLELGSACRIGSEIDDRDTNAYIRGYYTEVQI